MATKNFRPGKWNPRRSSDKYKRAHLRKFIEKKAARKKAEYRNAVVKPAQRLVDKLKQIVHSKDTPENKLMRALAEAVIEKHPQFSYLEALEYFFTKLKTKKQHQEGGDAQW